MFELVCNQLFNVHAKTISILNHVFCSFHCCCNTESFSLFISKTTVCEPSKIFSSYCSKYQPGFTTITSYFSRIYVCLSLNINSTIQYQNPNTFMTHDKKVISELTTICPVVPRMMLVLINITMTIQFPYPNSENTR